MPRYRLLSAHYSEEDKLLMGDKENEWMDGMPGKLLEKNGTIVGDGTLHKWTREPTPDMEGLDAESIKLVEKAKKRGDGLNPIDFLPLTMGQPDTSNDEQILGALKRVLANA